MTLIFSIFETDCTNDRKERELSSFFAGFQCFEAYFVLTFIGVRPFLQKQGRHLGKTRYDNTPPPPSDCQTFFLYYYLFLYSKNIPLEMCMKIDEKKTALLCLTKEFCFLLAKIYMMLLSKNTFFYSLSEI